MGELVSSNSSGNEEKRRTPARILHRNVRKHCEHRLEEFILIVVGPEEKKRDR